MRHTFPKLRLSVELWVEPGAQTSVTQIFIFLLAYTNILKNSGGDCLRAMALTLKNCTRGASISRRGRLNYFMILLSSLFSHNDADSWELICQIHLKKLSSHWKKSAQHLTIYKNNPRSTFREIRKNVFPPTAL